MRQPESLHLDRYFIEALHGNHWMVPTEILIAQRTMTLIDVLSSGAYAEAGRAIPGLFDNAEVALGFFGGSAIARLSVRTIDTPDDDTVVSLNNSDGGSVYQRRISADARSVAVFSRTLHKPIKLPLKIELYTSQFEMPGGSRPGKHLSVSELSWRDPRIIDGRAGYLTASGMVRTNPQASGPVAFSWTSRILPPSNAMELTVRHSRLVPDGQTWRFSFNS